MRIDAYHLPGILPVDTSMRSYGAESGPGVELHFPRLTPQALARQIDGLLAAREEHLVERPVADLIALVNLVANRFLREGDELRRLALAAIAAVSGHSAPMARLILDGMAADWTADPLERLVTAEFGNPRALDGFVSRPGVEGRSRAFGPQLAVHVFGGNVPGVSVTSLIRSLLVKAATLGKTAADEPVLAPLFARAIFEEDPGIGSSIAVAHWPGGDLALESVALSRTGAVIVYGGMEAVESLKLRTPAGVPFLAYGHRVSFGLVAREALGRVAAADVAADAALAVATFDQRGCVSPHLFYVEEGGDTAPAEWAALLAGALDRLRSELPRGRVSHGEAAAIQQAGAEAEFSQLAGMGHELHVPATGTDWTVIFDPDPEFTPSCLNRLVRVKPVASLDNVTVLVAPISSVLQTVGFAGPEDRMLAAAAVFGRLGVSRVATFRKMAWPPPTWHHDGRPPLADLVRWCDVE
jgi:hypothetical protein